MKKTMTRSGKNRTVQPCKEKKIGTTEKEIAEMGLCRTCENLETCTFPDAGKGVWFCEEYR